MFYKYKKYKKKYIYMKNQIGGDCIISPTDDDDIHSNKYSEYKLKLSLSDTNNNNKLKCSSTIEVANYIFINCYTPPDNNFDTQLFAIKNLDNNLDYINKFPIRPLLKYDINQIWYIIITNNNYIIALNKENYITNDIENADKQNKTFLYTANNRLYIEKCLLILKNYNFLIYSFDTIPSFEDFRKKQTPKTDNLNISEYENIFKEYNDIKIN